MSFLSSSSSSSSSVAIYVPSDEDEMSNDENLDSIAISDVDQSFLAAAHVETLKIEEARKRNETLSPITRVMDTTIHATTPFSTRYIFQNEEDSEENEEDEITFLSVGEMETNAKSVVIRSRRTSALRRLDSMAKRHRFEMINRAFEKVKSYSNDNTFYQESLLPPVPSSSSCSEEEDVPSSSSCSEEEDTSLQDITTRLASVTLIDATLSQTSSVSSPESVASQSHSSHKKQMTTCYDSLSIRSSPGRIESPTKTTMGDDRDAAVQWMQERSKIASGSTVRSCETKKLMYIFETFLETVRSQTLLVVPNVTSLNAWKDVMRKNTKTFFVYRKGNALSSRVLDTDIVMATYATVSSKECLVSSSSFAPEDKENSSWFQKTKRVEKKKNFRSRLHRIRFGNIFFILNDRLSKSKIESCTSLRCEHRWSFVHDDDSFADNERKRIKYFETALKIAGFDNSKNAIARLAHVTDESMTNDTRFPIFAVRSL